MEMEQAEAEFQEFCDVYAFAQPEGDNAKDWLTAKDKVLYLMTKGKMTYSDGALIYSATLRENGALVNKTYTIATPGSAKAITDMINKSDNIGAIRRFIQSCVEECKKTADVDDIPTHVFKDITTIISIITNSK